MTWYNPFSWLSLTPSKKKRLLLEEILQYLKEIIDLTADLRLGRENADDFNRHKKNRSLNLALAVKQKFEDYVNFIIEKMDRFELRAGRVEELYGEIRKLIDSLIRALEKNQFNEHWRIADSLKSKIERELGKP